MTFHRRWVWVLSALAVMVVAVAACNNQNAGPVDALPVVEASAAAAQPAAAGTERPVEPQAAEDRAAAENDQPNDDGPVRVRRGDPPFPRRFDVPDFPRGMTWLNTEPLSLRDLKGKFVLLDFWTYCCINCIHILPELKKLEEEFDKELVVIGVHSAKFETEKDTNNIREAILRYEIVHPVINDANHRIWNTYGVSSWPTIILIDPEGKAVWLRSGEFQAEEVQSVLRKAIPYYRTNKLLNETPMTFALERDKEQPTPLRFPGKILTDEAGGRLFITDSNHNRIVIATLDGKLLETIGSGQIGRADGDFHTASFNKPQGCALTGDSLYIADTENHLIRKADLKTKEVTTIAGTGRQARTGSIRKTRPRSTALSSPWALWIHNNDLYIAMAGPHQIWKMALPGGDIGAYAGNAREDIVDGRLLPSRVYEPGSSSFAQPSGLSSDGTWLYVADSEGSSVRMVPFNPRGEVRTLVGTSHLDYNRLFVFGDRDGPPRNALLQHCLEVVYHDGTVYVADTYNNKIKAIDAKSGFTKTIAGTGKHGNGDDPAEFREPAGLAYAAGKLYVADTNNHLIRTIDLDTGKVATLAIEGLNPPAK